MIQNGEIGDLQRVNWIITNWFRTQQYYDQGGWRATWAGEGGGVLTNQCPHQLDLVQWICGMPSSVTAHVSLGKYHDIEVEDEVSYFFTVLRTPATYAAGLGDGIENAKELYVGLDTSSSYQRVKQAFPTEVVGSIVAGCVGVIWTLCLAIGRMKRKAQLKLYMSYQDAGQVECNPK